MGMTKGYYQMSSDPGRVRLMESGGFMKIFFSIQKMMAAVFTGWMAICLCACTSENAKAIAFDPAVLYWGMTEEEALKALGLEEKDVTVEEENLPGDLTMRATEARRTVSGPDMMYKGVKIRLKMVFSKFEGEPAYDLGLNQIYVDICADEPNVESALDQELKQTLMGDTLGWEELNEQQKKAMKGYFSAVYPNNGFEILEMLGINGVGGTTVRDGTDEVYYTISWDAKNMAAWNRYGKDAG